MSENETKKTTPVVEINKAIKERLLDENPKVRETYINQEVSNKITSRVALVQKAISKISELSKELLKVKPDNVFLDVEGKVISESYTKETLEKKKKAEEQITKLENAISKAFEKADYGDLENLAK
jgi:hypothetical protein